MHFFEAEVSGQVKATQLVKVTPEGLRQIAARLETLAQAGMLPRESATYPITQNITFIYQPDITERVHSLTHADIHPEEHA
jgi:hypothetical protein